MVLQYNIPDFVNLLAFLGLTITTYTIFYFGRIAGQEKRVSLDIFILGLGINLIGISYLFRMWLDDPNSPVIVMTVAAGTVILSVGVIWVFYRKDLEISNLKKREKHIKSMIARLRMRYYKQELSEEHLKVIYPKMVKRLAEIEAKLGEKRK